MIQLFQVIFYQPLLNLLVFFYNIIPGQDIGLAIIAVTLVIKLILYPFSRQSLKSQKALQQLQPKINELKEKYKNEKEKMASEMMKLYKEEKVNPFSSCLPLIIQLPFLFAVYQVFRTGLTNGSLDLLYPFINNPGSLNPIAFNFFNLAEPNVILAILTGIAQFFQSKMLISTRPIIKSAGSKDEDMTAIMNKQMTYMMPVITVVIGVSLPSGLVLYWFLVTILTILQQFFIFKDKKNSPAVVGENN